MRVSAIVPATNDPPTLDRCIAALEGGPGVDEVIVVRSPKEAKAAEARNIGASRSTGDLLLFVDSDVEVHRAAPERIRTAFERDPSLVALFGSYDDAPASKGTVSAFRNLLHHHVHHEAPGPASTFWTGLGAVRRDAFEQVGGFDPSLDWLEDVDLGMRLFDLGARIELDPTIQGTHLKHWSFTGMVKTDFVGRAIPWMELMLRAGNSSSVLNLGWRHRASAVAAIVGAGGLVLRRPAVTVAGAATMIVLNHRFYRLLVRRMGLRGAAAGVGLHAVHHLVGVAAVPVGIAKHVARGRD
jgi:glycosyltransferase involved in cell wall biosynthesis